VTAAESSAYGSSRLSRQGITIGRHEDPMLSMGPAAPDPSGGLGDVHDRRQLN